MSASVKALFETTSFVVGPADNFDVPGYLVIRPERTVSGFDELRPQELAEFGILQGACAAVLSEVLKPLRFTFSFLVNPEFNYINMFYPGRWSLLPDSCRNSEEKTIRWTVRYSLIGSGNI